MYHFEQQKPISPQDFLKILLTQRKSAAAPKKKKTRQFSHIFIFPSPHPLVNSPHSSVSPHHHYHNNNHN